MKQKVLKKLSDQAGETIAETLVALLIASLALMMLAGAVSSAMNVVTRSKNAMDEYYADNNGIVAREDRLKSGTLTISLSGLRSSSENIPVEYWKNDKLSGTPVVAYIGPTPEP